MSEDCSICLQTIDRANRLETWPCGHAFCSLCIWQWVAHTRADPQCPNCKTKVGGVSGTVRWTIEEMCKEIPTSRKRRSSEDYEDEDEDEDYEDEDEDEDTNLDGFVVGDDDDESEEEGREDEEEEEDEAEFTEEESTSESVSAHCETDDNDDE